MVNSIFLDVGLILVLAVFISGVMRLLKQPLIIGYILTGILISPYALNLTSSTDMIATFAHAGVVFLLFILGLQLNPSVIKEVGKVSLITGIGQVVVTSVVGFFIGRWLGFSSVTSAYVAVALTFSSTIIILKLLSDKGDLEALYGKIAIGFLIVQDLIAVLILMSLSAGAPTIALPLALLFAVLKGVLLLLVVFGLAHILFSRSLATIAESQEFLFLFSVGWCFLLASLFYYLGFSLEAGALVAGMALSFSPFHREISSRMKPLRDFFVVLFFVYLGSQMVFANLMAYAVPLIVFSLYILIGNPLIFMILMGVLGYTKRTSFLAGLTVAQISEFSLILIAVGVQLGHLTQDILSLVTFVGLITIAGSTYLIMYGDRMYPALSKYLTVFERKRARVAQRLRHVSSQKYDLLLFGCHRIGHHFVDLFAQKKKKFLVVDYNPQTIQRLTEERIPCVYGDAGDPEFLENLPLGTTKMVVSTVPDRETNCLLIRKVKNKNKRALVLVVASTVEDALMLYKEGATYVIMPYFLGGKHAAAMIERHGFQLRKFVQERIIHLRHLQKSRKKNV